MKDGVHPKLYIDTVITCACGNSFTTASTLPNITVEICSACHPFYTGQQKYIDTEGRIDKFKKRQELAVKKTAIAQEQKKTKDIKMAKVKKYSPQTSLKEMLEQTRKQTSAK